ncbi:hypothetical protein B0I37DRAFT_57262 [Chaetomium sp. MPI-CAGE-AT-0009]|nr:hypothetical protein B0I37DRAFT_57262 [Chaetomium sp. MPI-CAGE-AT-0009]
MCLQTPPSITTGQDEQEEHSDMWPIWSRPGFLDTSSPEWELFPTAIRHLDGFTPLVNGQTIITADGISSSRAVDESEALALRPQAQNLTHGIVSGDQFTNVFEAVRDSPHPAPSQAFTDPGSSVSQLSIFPAAGLSGPQYDSLQYIYDTDFATQLPLDHATTVQHSLLAADRVQTTSHTSTLSPLTPEILDIGTFQSTELVTSSSATRSDGNSSRTLSTATFSAASGSPETIDTPPEEFKPEATLRVIRHGQTSTTRATMASRQPAQVPQPIKSSSRVAKQKRVRAVGTRVDVMRSGVAPKTVSKRDHTGRFGGDFMTWGLDQYVRTQASKAGQTTSLAPRARNACGRCHKMKQSCIAPEDDYSPCDRCKSFWLRNFFDRRNAKGGFQFEPCFKVEIFDLKLHRLGPTKYDTLGTWVKAKQELLQYFEYDTTQHLFLTQGFGEGIHNALCLRVARFEPVGPEDRTAYFWTDNQGRLRKHEMPPYFISDLDYARTSVLTFLRDARDIYIDKLLGTGDPLIRRTFDIAREFSADGKSPLISDALDAWVSGRFIEDHWKVFCGGLQIGATVTEEPGHPYHGFIPVTPIMDTQLDDLVIRVLIKPRLASFLARLKNKLAEKRRENWLELFLATFIMMSNIGWVIKDMIAMTTWKGLKPGNRGGVLTQGYMHACKTMLAHFHFACAGSVPLTMDFDKMSGCDNAYHGMTPDQLEYVKFVRTEIVRQRTKLSRWKDLSMYNDDAYWVYQLLCQDWNGEYKHPGEIDDFTEDDFLSSSST